MTLLKPGVDLGERERVPHPHFNIVFASPVRVAKKAKSPSRKSIEAMRKQP